jgi:hypothetical protein
MFKNRKDLFHLYINKARNEPMSLRETVQMLLQILKFVWRDLTSFFIKKSHKSIPDFRGKKILFANTFNNYAALSFLLEKYDDATLVCTASYVKKIKGAVNIRKCLHLKPRLGKYFFVLYVAIHPKFRARHYKLILTTDGFEEAYIEFLSRSKPAVIIISNDHHPHSRAFIMAASRLKIPCIYIQHASVTEVFPPLRNSHALLYGEYSENIYKTIGNSGCEIIKVGNHRFDGYKQLIKDKVPSGRIGVAFNTLDPIDKVLSLCDVLSKNFGTANIILRAHPAEKRKFQTDVEISNSKEINSLDFLKTIDVLIAGNSSILLEAAAMNVHAFQIYFEKVPDYFIDYYGFIRTGVAVEVKDRAALVEQIRTVFEKRTFDTRARTKLYDASIGEPFEFDVENHIIEVIDNLPAVKATK